MLDISMIPASEARTPTSFLIVNLSTLSKDPKTKVQTPSTVSRVTVGQGLCRVSHCLSMSVLLSSLQ